MLNPRGRRSLRARNKAARSGVRRHPLSRHEAGSKGAAVRQVEFRDESCGICAGSGTKGFRNASSATCRGTGVAGVLRQMEQAALDAGANGNPYAEATDAAAALLLDVRDGIAAQNARARLVKRLRQIATLPTTGPATFRVPEGFAWYALYPEAYAQTADIWAAEQQNRNAARLLVIGLRSIGTALGLLWRKRCGDGRNKFSDCPPGLRASFRPRGFAGRCGVLLRRSADR